MEFGKYILTPHALDRWQERHPNLDLALEIQTLKRLKNGRYMNKKRQSKAKNRRVYTSKHHAVFILDNENKVITIL